MRIVLPIRTYSEANRRDHWRAKADRTKEQRGLAAMFVLHAYSMRFVPMPCTDTGKTLRGKAVLAEDVTITLTRIAPRKFDDGAVEGSCKAVQDGIADALGIDDGDERLDWRYDQRKGRVGEYAVDVEIREKGTAEKPEEGVS